MNKQDLATVKNIPVDIFRDDSPATLSSLTLPGTWLEDITVAVYDDGRVLIDTGSAELTIKGKIEMVQFKDGSKKDGGKRK